MSKKAIVLGAGVTGLTSAWKLAEAGYGVTVIEKDAQLGGQARTIRYKDYYLDLGAHKIFTVMPHAQRILEELADGALLTRPKVGRIRFGDMYLPFPVGVKDMLRHLSLAKLTYLTASLVKARGLNLLSGSAPETYEAWFIANYGRGIYENFVKEATEKIWGVASNLSLDLARRRVTQATLLESLKRIFLRQKIKRVTKADYFYYPKYGCQVFIDALADRIRQASGCILPVTAVATAEVREKRIASITLSNSEVIELGPDDVVVSTIPKRCLTDAMRVELPGEVDYSLEMLGERNLLLVYIMVDQPRIMEENWIFFPERRFLFTRLSEMKNCSPFMAPEDKTFLCCEMTCHTDQKFSQTSLEYIRNHMVESLDAIHLVDKRKVIDTYTIYLDHAYPLWDVQYKKRLATILTYLDGFENLYSVGRQGAFIYGGIADCLDIGLVTAKFIADGRPRGEWPLERQVFDRYTVVD